MIDPAVYYVEPTDQPDYTEVWHDNVSIGAFCTRDLALSMATHLARSATDLGIPSRVIEVREDRRATIVFEGEPASSA